jgi:DNA-binding XRE family transcriptional regulator
MNASRQSFGELLRQHRLAACLTQEELAERARLSAETISALERGAGALELPPNARAELQRAAVQRVPSRAIPASPSGAVTFLFTTVEGGISRWESSPQQMTAAVARYAEWCDARLTSSRRVARTYARRSLASRMPRTRPFTRSTHWPWKISAQSAGYPCKSHSIRARLRCGAVPTTRRDLRRRRAVSSHRAQS